MQWEFCVFGVKRVDIRQHGVTAGRGSRDFHVTCWTLSDVVRRSGGQLDLSTVYGAGRRLEARDKAGSGAIGADGLLFRKEDES